MVIPKRHRIILKSKTAGNSKDRPHNSTAIFFEYIPLPYIIAVLVFQPRVLADGGGIDLFFGAIKPKCGCFGSIVEIKITLLYNEASILNS